MPGVSENALSIDRNPQYPQARRNHRAADGTDVAKYVRLNHIPPKLAERFSWMSARLMHCHDTRSLIIKLVSGRSARHEVYGCQVSSAKESYQKLSADADWWFSNSKRAVIVVIIVAISQKKTERKITFETVILDSTNPLRPWAQTHRRRYYKTSTRQKSPHPAHLDHLTPALQSLFIPGKLCASRLRKRLTGRRSLQSTTRYSRQMC
ncbi:hypothetical protein N7461_006721 [Penicillium sp. DV-2018c]|nr:hypothetical protein N7461_006721 [Penicillium sp. DV-2018c]